VIVTDVSLPQTLTLRDGSQVILRRLGESDAEQICILFPKSHTESDFLNFMPGEFDWTPAREREFIREHEHQAHSILLCAERGSELVALAGARQAPYRRYAHQAEIGITVFKSNWGLGLGRLMMQYLVDWSRVEGLRKLALRVFQDNHRAISLYQSLGFVEEGRLREDVLRADGRYSDTIIMGRFNSERR
jgi:RimJ/RimL family protein N-acetyltransferase